MVERRLNEIKVGLFVFLSIILVFVVIFALQGWWTTGRGYEITILFPNASGLQKGAPVRLAGVEVGRVIDISLTPDVKARVKVRIRRGVEIYSNYSIKIAVPIIGERYIEIKPTEPKGRKVEEGASVIGQIPISFEEMAGDVQSLVGKLQEEISSFGETATSLLKENVKIAIKQAQVFLERAISAVDNISRLAENVNRIIVANQENIEGTTSNLREAMGFLKDLLGESKENIVQATRNLQESTGELKNRLSSISNQLESIVEEVRKASARSDVIVGNIESASLSLGKAMANLEGISADIKQLTGNKEFIQNIQDSVRIAKEALEEARNLLQEISGKVKGLGKFHLSPSASLLYNEKRDYIRLNSQLFFPNQGFLFGVWDIGEGNKLDLQKVWKLNKWGMRGGIIHSKPGIGLDFAPYSYLNLYDLNKPRGDLYLNLGRNPYLQLGVEDIFSENEFVWGLKYEWGK